MSEFRDYNKAVNEIHAPEYLKQRVLEKAAQQKAAEKKEAQTAEVKTSALNIKHKKSVRKMVIAAAAAAAILAGCGAAVHYSRDLISHLKGGMGTEDIADYESLLVTGPTIPGESQNGVVQHQPIASARDDVAEYRVMEAINDSESLYFHMEVRSLTEDTLFIDQWVKPDSSVSELMIPGVTEGTVEEYAASLGKQLRYASLSVEFGDVVINGWGTWAETAPDGTLHFYGRGNNPSGEKQLEIGFCGFTYDRNSGIVPENQRTKFSVNFEDRSTAEETEYHIFKAFEKESPDIEEKFGITLDKLVLKETELGIYAKFTYRFTDEKYGQIQKELGIQDLEDLKTMEPIGKYLIGFVVVDENGEYFKTPGPAGGTTGIVYDGNGTFSYSVGVPKVEHPENLKFQILDSQFNKIGCYGFSK